MKRIEVTVVAIMTCFAIATAAWAASFTEGAKFMKFLSKFGSHDLETRAKRACICNEADPYLRAAGFLDFDFDFSDDVFRARCAIPQPTTPDGEIGIIYHCSSFTVIP